MKKTTTLWPVLLAVLMLSGCGGRNLGDSEVQTYAQAKKLYLDGDAEQAVRLLEPLSTGSKKFHQARLLLGKAYFISNRHSEAAETLAALLEEYPGYADASLWYIRALMAAGDYDGAEQALHKALAFSSEDPRFLHVAGSLWEYREDFQQALEYHQRAAIISDELADIYLSIGRIYNRFHVYDKSLEYLDKCLAVIDNNNPLYRPVSELRTRVEKELEK